MTPDLSPHLAEIESLCRRYDVEILELFGSAARGEFDPARSDFDFLVLYKRSSTVSPVDQYLGLKSSLEALLGREVDLVDVRGARNPYFIAHALKNRRRLYAA